MKKENEINFPMIESELLNSSLRSIDEVNEWIEHDYQIFFNRSFYEREKRLNSVNIRFKL